ncbi:MAG TPA: iron uptake porin, partial [Candidatus Sericytochromatia bacterium]
MKLGLSFEKAAPSALIFATFSCLAASLSPVQAAPDISPTGAAPIASSNQQFQASPELPIAKTESAASPSQPTVAVLATPMAESAIPASGGDTSVQTIQTAVSDLASATPSNPLGDLNWANSSSEVLETKVEDLRNPKHLEAQALPTQENPNEPMSPTATPQESGAAEEDDPMGQVTNVTQLSDVRPGDWAYEALRSLVERYGCIAGYPDGTFKGNRAMTRYEFAAGLNACLQQVERLIASSGRDLATRQDLERLQRLVNEFRP